jgi:hypothetical protein
MYEFKSRTEFSSLTTDLSCKSLNNISSHYSHPLFIYRHHEKYFRLPLLAIANSEGFYLYIFSQKKKQFISKKFEKLKSNVHSLDSCPRGKFLFLGLETGQIFIFQISHVEASPNTAECFFAMAVPEEHDCWDFSLINVPFQINLGSCLPQFLPCPAMIKVSPLFQLSLNDSTIYQPIVPSTANEKEVLRDRETYFNIKSKIKIENIDLTSSEIENLLTTKSDSRKIANIGVQKDEFTPLDDDSYGVFETKSDMNSEISYDVDDSTFFKIDSLEKNENNRENSIEEGKCSFRKGSSSDKGDVRCVPYCTFAVAWPDGRVCLCSLMATNTSGCESRGEYNFGSQPSTENTLLNEVDPWERHNTIANKKENFYVDDQREREKQKRREKQRAVTYGWAATHFFQTNETFCKVDFCTDYFKFSKETEFSALCLVICAQSGRYFFIEASSGTGKKGSFGAKNLPPPKNVFSYSTEIFLNSSGNSEDEIVGDLNISRNFACGKQCVVALCISLYSAVN